jgi:hypothetical protein
MSTNVQSDLESVSTHSRRGCLLTGLVVLGIFLAAWFFIRPGVFTIQPLGALPDGITVVYLARGPEMPFFSSPDALCLQMQGSVSLLCRMAAMAAVEEIADRIVLRLPYIETAYLLSTDGRRFDR